MEVLEDKNISTQEMVIKKVIDNSREQKKFYNIIKRVFDIVVSFI